MSLSYTDIVKMKSDGSYRLRISYKPKNGIILPLSQKSYRRRKIAIIPYRKRIKAIYFIVERKTKHAMGPSCRGRWGTVNFFAPVRTPNSEADY